jgi:hypothetical protein
MRRRFAEADASAAMVRGINGSLSTMITGSGASLLPGMTAGCAGVPRGIKSVYSAIKRTVWECPGLFFTMSGNKAVPVATA